MSEQPVQQPDNSSSSIFLDVLKYTNLPVFLASKALEHPDEAATVINTTMCITNPIYSLSNILNSDKNESVKPKEKLKNNIKTITHILCPITNLF